MPIEVKEQAQASHSPGVFLTLGVKLNVGKDSNVCARITIESKWLNLAKWGQIKPGRGPKKLPKRFSQDTPSGKPPTQKSRSVFSSVLASRDDELRTSKQGKMHFRDEPCIPPVKRAATGDTTLQHERLHARQTLPEFSYRQGMLESSRMFSR